MPARRWRPSPTTCPTWWCSTSCWAPTTASTSWLPSAARATCRSSCSPAELAARIVSVLRRSRKVTPGTGFDFGTLRIDVATREVFVHDEVVEMTAKEFDLLAFLAASPRQVFAREQLLRQVWESSSEWQDSATVTEHVRRVRRKIEDDPDSPRWVRTVRGVGYRFEP